MFASVVILASALPAVLSSPFQPRPIKPTLIYQAPASQSGAWLENLAVTRHGSILATRLDVPELYLIDPFTKASSLIHSFANNAVFGNTTTGLLGIAEYATDRFAIAAGKFDLATTTPTKGTWGVWSVDIRKGEAKVDLLVKIPEGIFFNGMTTVPMAKQHNKAKRDGDKGDEDKDSDCQDQEDVKTVLVGDSTAGVIYAVDPIKKSYSLYWDNDTLKPAPNSSIPIGVNGIQTSSDSKYFYYNANRDSSLYRIALSSDYTPTGMPQKIASGFPFLDDLALSRKPVHSKNGNDGFIAYVCTNAGNTVVKVLPDGTQSVLVGSIGSLDVAGSTAAAWGRTEQDLDTLYIVTAGAHAAPVNGTITEPGKLVAVKVRR
jgi:hypothetical protein